MTLVAYSSRLRQYPGDIVRPEFEKQRDAVVAKECLCVGLSNAASLCYEVPFLKSRTAVNICPGPNIVNFSKVVSLRTMIDHIYGRADILTNPNRPHMFIAEMKLYFNYLKERLSNGNGDPKRTSWHETFVRNLTEAIAYYQSLPIDAVINREAFDQALVDALHELQPAVTD